MTPNARMRECLEQAVRDKPWNDPIHTTSATSEYAQYQQVTLWRALELATVEPAVVELIKPAYEGPILELRDGKMVPVQEPPARVGREGVRAMWQDWLGNGLEYEMYVVQRHGPEEGAARWVRRWSPAMKVKTLPGTKMSSATVLSNLMEEVENIENVVVIYHYKGYKRPGTCWNCMPTKDLAYYATVLAAEIMDRINNEDENPDDA